MPKGERGNSGPLDWRGLTLVSAAVPLIVYGSESRSASTLAAGAVALIAFVALSRRRSDPILDLTLFANRAYTAATTTGAFAGAAMFGAALLLPLYFQLGRGATPLETGVSLISLALGTAVTLPVTGRLTDRVGGGIVCVLGGVATVATTVPFALIDTHADAALVQVLLFARGVAIAFAVVPTGSAAYKAVTAEQLPDAATQFNIGMRIGGALGGALITAMLVDQGLHAAFWWLTGASALGLLSALWLMSVTRPLATRSPPELSRSGAS